jgi:hypothetical protein
MTSPAHLERARLPEKQATTLIRLNASAAIRRQRPIPLAEFNVYPIIEKRSRFRRNEVTDLPALSQADET